MFGLALLFVAALLSSILQKLILDNEGCPNFKEAAAPTPTPTPTPLPCNATHCQWFPTEWAPPRNDSACAPSVAAPQHHL